MTETKITPQSSFMYNENDVLSETQIDLAGAGVLLVTKKSMWEYPYAALGGILRFKITFAKVTNKLPLRNDSFFRSRDPLAAHPEIVTVF